MKIETCIAVEWKLKCICRVVGKRKIPKYLLKIISELQVHLLSWS